MASGKNPHIDTYTIVLQTHLKGITAIRLEACADPSFVKGGPGRASNGNFALSDFRVTAAPLDHKEKAVSLKFVRARADFEQKGLPVAAAIDKNPTSGWAVDPQFGKDHAAVFEFETPAGFDGGTALTCTLAFKTNNHHSIGRPRLSLTTRGQPSLEDRRAVPEAVAEIANRRDQRLTSAQLAVLARWTRRSDERWQQLNKAVENHRRKGPKPATIKALICSEGVPALRTHTQGGDFLEQTHFLNRGDPNQKGAIAPQGFLQVLMRNPAGEKHWQTKPPAGAHTTYQRRALADWITDVDAGAGHLLARVIVNRLWQHHMGRGIVATPSDFGYQGDKPTHPELLDWLASELIAKGWRLKPIHKLIMQSAVYRQGSQFDKERARVDVDNRLHWRRVPQRLEGEIIRDSILAVGETLDPRLFGPGTLDLNHKRRSIYFFIKRSKLIPTMVLFDGPDSLQGAEQRTTTTIAPQALLLMNNAMVRSCAEGLSKRVSPSDNGKLEDAVRSGYAVTLGRAPTERELAESLRFVEEQRASYRAERKADARRLALTDFCQVLMELNEFIYVD
jgi:hypothetical protein